jgi:hypothetical protein
MVREHFWLNVVKGTQDAAASAESANRGRTPSLARATALANQTLLVREIFRNPFHPVTPNHSWLTSTVTSLAQAIYDDRAFDRLSILADALEDAGCTNQDILAHCRGGGEHVRGCWVVDLLTGRE